MDSKLILDFLRAVTANNNREWFQQHKGDYEAARGEFEQGVGQLLGRIASFDDSIAHLSVTRKVRLVSHMSSSHHPQSMSTPIQGW